MPAIQTGVITAPSDRGRGYGITRTPKKILRTRPLRALAYSAPQGFMTPPRKNQETPAAGPREATRPGPGPAALCRSAVLSTMLERRQDALDDGGGGGLPLPTSRQLGGPETKPNQAKPGYKQEDLRPRGSERAREGHPFPSVPSAGDVTHPAAASFRRVPVRPPHPCLKPARSRAPRDPLYIKHEPAPSSPPPGSRAERTVRVVSTDRHLQNELGRAAFVHLQQTNIGHIDGHFVDEKPCPGLCVLSDDNLVRS
ncbi:hypothetical protein THAOC_37379 [Thalassiosira oceanica]|uniref:Uncharacterized protein n=1 Tax=Thalassiosira oceanica TaxID=159749 RepID=K0R688_THAOC|nr:hypothetical protein THAOC_37379 [Thalassiosira oceanica]|eukprot:EJK44111.1 hypothetical protein THAOC_37379 [Thalassiosira oceanica]